MNAEKDQILENAYYFFLELFKSKTVQYNKKQYRNFKINPFTIQANATAFGEVDSYTIAKAVVYPFALGTSMATSFGNNIQKFIVTTMGGSAKPSIVQGMDIEYTDVIDSRQKYCQLKSGPNTINYDDVDTIENHFKGLRNLARTNHLNVNVTDNIVGVIYGEQKDISSMYKKIEDDGYTVLVGEDFWYHLTGIEGLYSELVEQAQLAAQEAAFKQSIENLILRVQAGIDDNKETFGLN